MLKQKVVKLEAVDADLLSTTTTATATTTTTATATATTTTTTTTTATATTTTTEPEVVKAARANGRLSDDGTYTGNIEVGNDADLEGMRPLLLLITKTTGSVTFHHLVSTTTLAGVMPIMTSASYLSIYKNAKLASVLTAFVKVTSLTSTGSGITIYNNADLVDMPGFEQEVQFASDLVHVTDNAKLTSLTGLHMLKFTHSSGARLNIKANPLLSREAVCGFWNAVKARGNPPHKLDHCATGWLDAPMWGSAAGPCGNFGTSANC